MSNEYRSYLVVAGLGITTSMILSSCGSNVVENYNQSSDNKQKLDAACKDNVNVPNYVHDSASIIGVKEGSFGICGFNGKIENGIIKENLMLVYSEVGGVKTNVYKPLIKGTEPTGNYDAIGYNDENNNFKAISTRNKNTGDIWMVIDGKEYLSDSITKLSIDKVIGAVTGVTGVEAAAPAARATETPFVLLPPTATIEPTVTPIDRLDGGVGVQLATDGSVEKIWPPMGMSETDQKTFFDQFDVESMGVKDKVKLVYADRFLRYVDVNDPTIIYAEWQKFENVGFMYWNYKEQLVQNMLADNCEVAPEGVLSLPDYGIHADNKKGMDYFLELEKDISKIKIIGKYIPMTNIVKNDKETYSVTQFVYEKVLAMEMMKPSKDVASWVVDIVIKGFDNGRGWFVCRSNKDEEILFVLPSYNVSRSYKNLMGVPTSK